MCLKSDNDVANLPVAEKGRRKEELKSRWPGGNSWWFTTRGHLASAEETPKRIWSKKLSLVAPSQVGKSAWSCWSHPVGWWPTAAHPLGAAGICSVPGMKGLQSRCRVQRHAEVLGNLPLRATSWNSCHLQSTGGDHNSQLWFRGDFLSGDLHTGQNRREIYKLVCDRAFLVGSQQLCLWMGKRIPLHGSNA